MNLFGYRGLLLYVVEGPSSSKITQQSKYLQLYGRQHLLVDFLTTPTIKTGIVSNPLEEFQIVCIGNSKLRPKLCTHWWVLQHEMIVHVHLPPLALDGFYYLQFWIGRFLTTVNTSWCLCFFFQGQLHPAHGYQEKVNYCKCLLNWERLTSSRATIGEEQFNAADICSHQTHHLK